MVVDEDGAFKNFNWTNIFIDLLTLLYGFLFTLTRERCIFIQRVTIISHYYIHTRELYLHGIDFHQKLQDLK